MDHISPEDLEKIDRYISGEMEAGEHAAFSAQINADPDLKTKVEEARLLFLGIKEFALQSDLNSFHKELPVKQRTAVTRSLFSSKTWLVAASVIVLALISFLWIYNRGENDNKLYAKYYEADPGLMTTMGIADDYEFNRGMVDYRSGKYSETIERWEPIAAAQPARDTLQYFLGVAHLAAGNTSSAIRYLNKLVLMESSFKNEAYWYLGLAHLKEGNKEEASKWIRLADHPRKDELESELK